MTRRAAPAGRDANPDAIALAEAIHVASMLLYTTAVVVSRPQPVATLGSTPLWRVAVQINGRDFEWGEAATLAAAARDLTESLRVHARAALGTP